MNIDMIKQSLPFLLLCGIGEIFAGTLFGHMKDLFMEYPGLIIIMPAVIGLRGKIVTSLGSRLSSSIHLGSISAEKMLKSREVRENIKVTLFMGIIMAVVTSVLAYVSSVSAGVKIISLFSLILMVLLSSLISGVILIFITIIVIGFSFSKGLDPDNVTAPILTTVGDVITIFCVYLSVILLNVMGLV